MVLRLLFALAAGAMIGGFVGVAVTGDWIYTIVWAVALAVVVLVGIALIVMRTRSRSFPGSGSRLRGPLRWIAFGALAAIGLGAVAIPVIVTAASGRLDDPLTGTHQATAMNGIVAAAGTKTATELDLFPGYLLVDVVRPPGHSTVDEWVWQYGRATNTGPEVVPPENIRQASFDVTSIDMTQVLADVTVARKLGTMPASSDLHVGVRREPDAGDELQTTVFLSTASRSATVVFDSAGKVLDRFGSAFH